MKAPVERRIIAFLVDVILFKGVAIVSSVAGFLLYSSFKSAVGSLLSILLVLVGILLSIAYLLLRDGLFGGASAGKKLVKLRVVKSDGSRCDFVSSALRNITLLIPLLNIVELMLGVVDRRGLRIGDKIAGTQVVE